jgi:hypothetical protein
VEAKAGKQAANLDFEIRSGTVLALRLKKGEEEQRVELFPSPQFFRE